MNNINLDFRVSLSKKEIATLNKKGRYYVYAHRKSFSATPFYIGYGHGKRCVCTQKRYNTYYDYILANSIEEVTITFFGMDLSKLEATNLERNLLHQYRNEVINVALPNIIKMEKPINLKNIKNGNRYKFPNVYEAAYFLHTTTTKLINAELNKTLFQHKIIVTDETF